MYPVEPPKSISSKRGRMVPQLIHCPILMNEREEQVHQMPDLLVVRWDVISYVDWLFPKPPSKLGDIGNRGVVQSP
jgi:hypothetical protein